MMRFAFLALLLLSAPVWAQEEQPADTQKQEGYQWAQMQILDSVTACENPEHESAFIEGCKLFVTEWQSFWAEDYTFSADYQREEPAAGEPITHNFE